MHTLRPEQNAGGREDNRLPVGCGIPAREFWLMHQASQPALLLGTYTEPVVNEDGSVDLYFGPKAPTCEGRNWIETIPGKGWTGIFRL